MTPDWQQSNDQGFFDDLGPMSKRIPIWYQGDRDNQNIGLALPWLGLDTAECDHLNSFCYLIKTSHTRNALPPLCSLSTFWAPWDDDLSELTQFHIVVFDWNAYQDILRTIADDAINMIDDGAIAEVHRLQTFVTVHFFETADLVDTIGGLHRSYMQLRAEHGELLQRFEATGNIRPGSWNGLLPVTRAWRDRSTCYFVQKISLQNTREDILDIKVDMINLAAMLQ